MDHEQENFRWSTVNPSGLTLRIKNIVDLARELTSIYKNSLDSINKEVNKNYFDLSHRKPKK